MIESTQIAKIFRAKLNIVVLVFAIMSTFILRVAVIAEKYTLTHDEGISYLSATCHQGNYGSIKFEVSLTKASQWKDYLRVEQLFCFKQIKDDLAQADIHPPLYFWLLHLWSSIYGVTLWTGPSLNTVVAIITTCFLFKLSHYILGNRAEANLVTFTYALSPAIILISVEARQYDLLALCALLLVWQVIRLTNLRKQKIRDVFLLIILTVAGALTHYHFALTVIVCIIFLIARLLNRDTNRLIVALISIGLGYLGAFLLHPYLFPSLHRQFGWSKFNYANFMIRLEKVIVSFYAYYYIIILVLLILTWALVMYYRQRSVLNKRIREVNLTGFYILFFFFGVAGAIIVLYAIFITPQHAMEAKYLSMAWPFFAFIPVFILRVSFRFKTSLTAFFYFTPLLFALITPSLRGLAAYATPDPSTLLENADLVVIDNTARGIFPRLVWHVPDETSVIVSTQKRLIQHSDLWLSSLTNNSIYISEISYKNTDTLQEDILGLIDKAGYKVVPIKGGIWGLGTVFKIQQE